MTDTPPERTTRSRALRHPVAAAALPPPREPVDFVEHVRQLTDVRSEILNLATPRREAPTPEARQLRLDAMRQWQTAARERLDDLQAGRTGPDGHGRPIPVELQPVAADLQRRLALSMSDNAARMATLEGARRRWHVAAKLAREGIELRDEVAAAGAAPRPAARLHLRLAHATYMLEGNSPRLRRELAAAARATPGSKGLAYWRARYELMAGHHAEARDAIQGASDYPPARNTVLPLLDPDAAQAPWLTWPANFYTYRYTLTSDDQLRGMQGALSALSNDAQMVQNWLTLGIPQVALDRLKDHAVDAGLAIVSLLLWSQANRDFERRKYDSAARNYAACQRSLVAYFAARHPDLPLPQLSEPDPTGSSLDAQSQLQAALDVLATKLIDYSTPNREIWTHFRNRYMSITLEELHNLDWRRPNVVPLAYEFAAPLPNYGDSTDFAVAFARLLVRAGILKSLQIDGDKVQEKLDAPLLALALVFCPLGIAEASRLRRNFDEGLSQCRQLLRRHSSFKVLSEIVEKPFVKILKAQILLDKADGQYKSRALAAAPATHPDGSLRYQGLEAAETYQGVLLEFEDQGQYVNRVNAAVQTSAGELSTLLRHTFHPVAARESGDPNLDPPLDANDRRALAQFGKRFAIETIVPRSGDYPEPDKTVRPHEALIRFEPPAGDPGPGVRESNPLIYALILEARARLLQMESGLNYLGYSDSYVPPWRFNFLIDRARYFVEHSKNAQREYLNFLTNAENEEFQEQTAAQNVEMEKGNIRVETARVDQATAEVAAAKASGELALLTAANAQTRLGAYAEFDARADELAEDVLGGVSGLGARGSAVLSGAATGAAIGGAAGGIGAVGGALIGGALGFMASSDQITAAEAELAITSEQREFELTSLGLTAAEAGQASVVALQQTAVAAAGLQVAGLQRAASVLRHEYALQNLSWLRNRTLNAELWYRLASSIRGVADTYLRYGIELAFLGEQAYEFEADKRVDVIRFDYDVSYLGDMLAGDFLLRDLDTLERDLLITQRIRQQRVRYVLSLAREYPAALQELRDSGRTTFTLRLEQLERRFPGLFNLRVAGVDVLPLALMDASRFSLELTHLGSGQVRLTAGGQPSAEPVAADWLTGLGAQWSVRPRITAPETSVFSGMTRADVEESGFVAANQRDAFEGVAGASAWRVDLSAKENRIVPDSLADLLVTFTLAGYHDASLRDAVEHAPRRPLASTSWLSGHQTFSDAFYELNRSGRMEWRVTPTMLGLQGQAALLRNIGVLGVPSQRRPELGRIACAYSVRVDIDAAGNVSLLDHLPPTRLIVNGLDLDATFDGSAAGADIRFDFGDGTPLADATALPHTYPRPGLYDVLIRIAQNGHLSEYRAAVVVSTQHAVSPPVIALPQLQTFVEAGEVRVAPTATVTSGEALGVTWRVDGEPPEAGAAPPSFLVSPGRHVLRIVATRPLVGRFYSQQRYDPVTPVQLERFFAASNRTFDPDTGAETTAALNGFAQHVFGGPTLSAVDRWTLDLPLDDNPGLVGVTAADTRRHELGELTDIVLTLEYVSEGD